MQSWRQPNHPAIAYGSTRAYILGSWVPLCMKIGCGLSESECVPQGTEGYDEWSINDLVNRQDFTRR